MNKPTEIKYSLDENGEPYFAATHIQAVQGLNFDEDKDLSTIIFNLENEINKVSEENSTLRKFIEDSKIEISNLNTNIETCKNTIETLKTKVGSLEMNIKNSQDEIEKKKDVETNEGGSSE
ncbi:hypothetical protein [Staphylococcus epidermidis]|uniref:Uncharacterized protein n=1 Tax=uncultured Caudovirales phage TaxID=2100421 RepID=A0A2H4JCK2_9CAUD|nr:hypothetical protein [Staphylococcus epidermidis]ASN72985.1 hypothetical protein 7F22_4 [uncultured Caudovirales phage]OAX02342.1 hypothetical protein A9J96_11850 [Staphylococcus epidermidis]